jgi:hypothetical protein
MVKRMLFTSIIPASYHASINRKSGPRVVGHIDRSDETLRFIITQDDERYTIERSDILAIDHPGKLSMGIGGGLMAFSLGIFALAASNGFHIAT